MDSSPPGSPIPGILQVKTVEWGAIAFPKNSIEVPLKTKNRSLSFSIWFISLSEKLSLSIHVATNGIISYIPLYMESKKKLYKWT